MLDAHGAVMCLQIFDLLLPPIEFTSNVGTVDLNGRFELEVLHDETMSDGLKSLDDGARVPGMPLYHVGLRWRHDGNGLAHNHDVLEAKVE
jgi:hypothetical protein